jgi:hypothetical protein
MRDPPIRMTWQQAARFRRRTLTDRWGVSIKPRHWRRNFEKPRLYVLITKNHDFLGNFFQFALIASWTRIDTESDRWDPPVSAKLVLYVLTWTGTHLSIQLKIKMEKSKKQVIPNLYPPVGHPHRRPPPPGRQDRPVPSSPPRALPHSPPHALTAPSCTRRPMFAAPHPHRAAPELVAPCCLDIAAQSSSPHAAPSSSLAGQEWGRRGDPPEMGQGEEIRWRWTRGGDGQEEEDSTCFFIFFIGLISGPLSNSAQIEFSLSAQHLQVGPTYQIWCQFVSNSRSVWIKKITRKVVVFCD